MFTSTHPDLASFFNLVQTSDPANTASAQNPKFQQKSSMDEYTFLEIFQSAQQLRSRVKDEFPWSQLEKKLNVSQRSLMDRLGKYGITKEDLSGPLEKFEAKLKNNHYQLDTKLKQIIKNPYASLSMTYATIFTAIGSTSSARDARTKLEVSQSNFTTVISKYINYFELKLISYFYSLEKLQQGFDFNQHNFKFNMNQPIENNIDFSKLVLLLIRSVLKVEISPSYKSKNESGTIHRNIKNYLLDFIYKVDDKEEALDREILLSADFNVDNAVKKSTNKPKLKTANFFASLASVQNVDESSSLMQDDELVSLIESQITAENSKNQAEPEQQSFSAVEIADPVIETHSYESAPKKQKLNDNLIANTTFEEIIEEGTIETISSNTTMTTENITIKTEMADDDNDNQQIYTPILKLDLQTLDLVVKTLRGNSQETSYSCAVYARKIIDYFQTGEIPTEPVLVDSKFNKAANFEITSKARLCHRQIKTESSEKPNPTLEEDAILTKIQNNEPLKRGEKRKLVMTNNASFINRNTLFGSYAPCHKIDVYEESNEGFDFKSSLVDIDSALQKETNYLNLNTTLQSEADENVNKVSFGVINLSKCDKYVDKNPHAIVYYATPENVYYIDAQAWNGEKQAGQYHFQNLAEHYEFANDAKKLSVKTWSNNVFHTALGPNLPEKNISSLPKFKK